MRIIEENIDKINILSIQGRVEMIHIPQLREIIARKLSADKSSLLVDLSDLDYINSTGLGIFIRAAKQMNEEKRRLGFCSLRENIMEIFKIAGFIKILDVYINREEAICAFKEKSFP
jgi:anti-sigma B factor antagonist